MRPDESAATTVDRIDPSEGELIYTVGSPMSLSDLSAKTGLSVQRLISLSAKVFGEEALDADTRLQTGNRIWLNSNFEGSGDKSGGLPARGAAGARAPPDRRRSMKGSRKKWRAAADLGTALRTKDGRFHLMNFFQAANMLISTHLGWMGEKSCRLPLCENPKELFGQLSTLNNESPGLGDAEAWQVQSDNNRRLAAMEAQLDFESLPKGEAAKLTRGMQASLLCPEAGDPVIPAFKAQLEGAVKRQGKQDRKAVHQPGAPCNQRTGATDVQGRARALISEMRRARDEDGSGNGPDRWRAGFPKRRGWVGVDKRQCFRCGETGHIV